MSLFSIIIPVYNVEDYLHECVNSVLDQSFKDYEIILVDDGSTDRSGMICDKFKEKNDNIYVIHKKNGGASEARNFGINKAKGTWIMFLDSDDFWDDNEALEKVYKLLENKQFGADVVLFQAKLLYPDGTLLKDKGVFEQGFNNMSKLESLEYLSRNGLLIGSACSKVIRRKFLIDNGLVFKVGVKHEDIDWVLRLANCLPKYLYTDQYFYIYRKGRKESVTSNVNYDFLMSFAIMLENFLSFTFCNKKTKECLLGYVAYEYSILLAQSNFLNDRSEKKMLANKLKSLKPILSYDIHPKVKMINKSMKLLGYHITKFLLGKYLKYRKR